MSSASKLRAAILKKREAMSARPPSQRKRSVPGRQVELMKIEAEEIVHRGGCCERCKSEWREGCFQWARKKGSSRKDHPERLKISYLLCAVYGPARLREEFPHVWLMCQPCHVRYPDWNGAD